MTEKIENDNDNFVYSVSAQKSLHTRENNFEGFKIWFVKIDDDIFSDVNFWKIIYHGDYKFKWSLYATEIFQEKQNYLIEIKGSYK